MVSEYKYCWHCGTKKDNNEVCSNCRMDMKGGIIRYCPMCGAQRKDSLKNCCKYCGLDLRAITPKRDERSLESRVKEKIKSKSHISSIIDTEEIAHELYIKEETVLKIITELRSDIFTSLPKGISYKSSEHLSLDKQGITTDVLCVHCGQEQKAALSKYYNIFLLPTLQKFRCEKCGIMGKHPSLNWLVVIHGMSVVVFWNTTINIMVMTRKPTLLTILITALIPTLYTLYVLVFLLRSTVLRLRILMVKKRHNTQQKDA